MIKQKDDVVYIADSSADWRFFHPLTIGGESGSLSIAIALQKDQTIALLLRKYNALGKSVLKSSGDEIKIKAAFGAINNALG